MSLPDPMVQPEVEKRAAALARGAKHYFTGKACPAGHNGMRDSLIGECCECRRLWRREQRQRDRARLATQQGI